jgi:copper chaperone CopZ
MRAISALTEVYGVRKIRFDESASTVHVEFDASRLKEPAVAALLRNAGLDIREKLVVA